MDRTVYVALSGVSQEGHWVIGVASTVERAKAMCQKDCDEDGEKAGELQWGDNLIADHPASTSQYFAVKACVVED